MDANVGFHVQFCHSASPSSSRRRSSLSSSCTSSCPGDNRGFLRLRFCFGQPRLAQEELQSRAATLVSKEWRGSDNLRSPVGNSARCRVIRDVRDEQALPTSRYWPPGEVSSRREGALLPFEDYKEERFSGHFNEYGETSREDPSLACIHDEDEDQGEESGDNQAPLSLDSRVETLEGIPARQWLWTCVESIAPRLRGIIILNVLTLLYGSNIAVIKETELSLDPASFSAGRFAIAALFFAPFLKDAFKQPGVAKAGIELGVWAGIAYLAQAVGLMTTDAGRASFFTTFTVLTVPFIAGLMGKNIPILTWLAAVAALFGVGLLETSGAPPSVGDAWSLLSAVVFGIHMIRTEHHSRNFNAGAAFPIIALQLSVITASSLMWSFANHVTSGDALPTFATLDWSGLYHTALGMPWGPMFYTGLFSTAFCLSAELVAMRDVSATEAAVISSMEPLWGAAFAWFALGERWGLRGWIGAAFILGGSVATQIWGSAETPVKPANIALPALEEQEALRLQKMERDRTDHKPRSASERS